MKPHSDRSSRQAHIALRMDDARLRIWSIRALECLKGGPQRAAEWHLTATAVALGRTITKLEDIAHVALGVERHPPGHRGDLAGSQASVDAE
jgi:hypothetical protein